MKSQQWLSEPRHRRLEELRAKYRPSPARAEFGPEPPPDDAACRLCYEWRRYPAGQEHFGWSWWRICSHGCPCEHHKDEVWIA